MIRRPRALVLVVFCSPDHHGVPRDFNFFSEIYFFNCNSFLLLVAFYFFSFYLFFSIAFIFYPPVGSCVIWSARAAYYYGGRPHNARVVPASYHHVCRAAVGCLPNFFF